MSYSVIQHVKVSWRGKECSKCNVPDRWTVEDGNYVLGNKFHPVAVMVPLDDEVGNELVKTAIELGVAIAGFCKTANIGIEKVVCNVLANPNIRYLVVVGHDTSGHRSGEAMIKLWRYGVDPESRRVLNCDAPTAYIPNLPLEAIERFRDQVIVIDMLGVTDREMLRKVIRGCIQEPWNAVEIEVKGIKYRLFDPGAYDLEPYIVKVTSKVSGGYVETLSQNLTVVVARSVADAYREVIRLIERFGRCVESRFGITKELMNVVIHVLDPLCDEVPREYPLGAKKYLEEYCRAILEGRSIEGYEYSYGERLRVKFGDQLRAIVDKLRSEPSTRQAVAVFWSPYEDLVKTENPPCFILWQFMIRDGKLHATVYMRSHDFRSAFVHNVFAVREVMKYITEELKRSGLDVDLGTITFIACSCHVYENYR
ncbi:MAG: hypothetical protein DRJ40_04895 [Thermoprotei archaeon]|nr:MAG: hypothetical protein DRJ40_04630 [Thermoprotei archaeon]RLE56738.1 MAG: hypothetical protein DRJ40_04895 [Thermoprotei archaeon]